MINDNVPRTFGLDAVITAIIHSKNPLQTIATDFTFYPSHLVLLRQHGATARELIQEGISYDSIVPTSTWPPSPRIALESIAHGGDYTDADEKILKEVFPFGEQEYFLLDTSENAYNPSFSLVLFPTPTVSIPQKESMLTRFTKTPWIPIKNYEHLKTLVVSDGNHQYLVTVSGEERADFRAVAMVLGVPYKKIALVPQNEVAGYVGRPVGAVSPFMHHTGFDNISGVFFADNVVSTGYARPHYEIPLDTRSSLVVSDMRDVIPLLQKMSGYPAVKFFQNIVAQVNN